MILKNNSQCIRDEETIEKTPVRIEWDVNAAEKGGFEHFMLKEMYEQPKDHNLLYCLDIFVTHSELFDAYLTVFDPRGKCINNCLRLFIHFLETADTLAALRESRKRGARVLGIVNVVGSSIAREADNVMYTWASSLLP